MRMSCKCRIVRIDRVNCNMTIAFPCSCEAFVSLVEWKVRWGLSKQSAWRIGTAAKGRRSVIGRMMMRCCFLQPFQTLTKRHARVDIILHRLNHLCSTWGAVIFRFIEAAFATVWLSAINSQVCAILGAICLLLENNQSIKRRPRGYQLTILPCCYYPS